MKLRLCAKEILRLLNLNCFITDLQLRNRRNRQIKLIFTIIWLLASMSSLFLPLQPQSSVFNGQHIQGVTLRICSLNTWQMPATAFWFVVGRELLGSYHQAGWRTKLMSDAQDWYLFLTWFPSWFSCNFRHPVVNSVLEPVVKGIG